MKIARLCPGLRPLLLLYVDRKGGFTKEDLKTLDTALRPLYAGIQPGLMKSHRAAGKIVVRLFGKAKQEVVIDKIVGLGYQVVE